MRLFLAIEIPKNIKKRLVEIQERLRSEIPSVRWEKPEKLHITLVFLGKVGEERIVELEETVRKGLKGVKGVNVGLAKVGFFPKTRPRVVLVEVSEGKEEIERLQKWLAEALLEAEFEFAKLSQPHVTLGRFKKGMGYKVLGLGPSFAKDMEGTSFEVKEVVIVESKLHPDGAIHTPITRILFRKM